MIEVELADRRRCIAAAPNMDYDLLSNRERLLALIKKGMTFAEIGVIARCSDKTVKRWCDLLGIPRDRRRQCHEEILALAAKGKRPWEIAETLGCSVDTARRVMIRAGYDLRISQRKEIGLKPLTYRERQERQRQVVHRAVVKAYKRAGRCWVGCPGWEDCLDSEECVL